MLEKECRGPALSSDAKTVLEKLRTNQKVYIENIKAKGPDGTVRNIGALSFKVIVTFRKTCSDEDPEEHSLRRAARLRPPLLRVRCRHRPCLTVPTSRSTPRPNALILFNYIREADVMWYRRVWREIDLREKVEKRTCRCTIRIEPINDRKSLSM